MVDFAQRLPIDLGRVTASPAVIAALAKANLTAMALLARHAAGDWGEADDETRNENYRAAFFGSGLVSSVFPLATDDTVLIVTELDRQETSLILAEEI